MRAPHLACRIAAFNPVPEHSETGLKPPFSYFSQPIRLEMMQSNSFISRGFASDNQSCSHLSYWVVVHLRSVLRLKQLKKELYISLGVYPLEQMSPLER